MTSKLSRGAIKYGVYTTTSSIVIPANGVNDITIGTITGIGRVLGAFIDNTNDGVVNLFVQGAAWYGNLRLNFYNPKSSDITIPADRNIYYIYV